MDINSIKIRTPLPKDFLRVTFIITYLFFITSFPQIKEPRFEHITIEDGLPENSITAILQDHLGYMWFGTQDGLARYDGYKFNNYKTEIGNPRSISYNWISSIYEDHLNNLWIGTQPIINQFDDNDTTGGLNLFDRKTESFTRFKNNKEDSNTINSNYITSVKEDDLGNLWVGTNAGLNLFDRNKKTFQRIKFLDKSLTEETYNFISSLNKQNIESITRVGNNADVRKKIIIKEKTIVMVVMVGEEASDLGWVENSKGMKVIEYEEGNNFFAGGRSDNRITIVIDTLETGSYLLRYKSDASHSYNNWRNNSIRPFYPEWWGIQLFRMNDSTLKAFLKIKRFERYETKVVVRGIIQDIVSKKIFITTNWGLYTFYPPKNGSEKSIIIKTSDKIKLGLGFLTNIFQSSNGLIWLGASINGLFSYNPASGEVKHHKNPNIPNQLIYSLSNIITEDSKGILWYGNPTEGLIRYDPIRNKFDSYKYDEKNKYSLSGNVVFSVYEDKSGVLWVGTRLWGLNKWDRKKWKFNSVKYNPFDRSVLSGFGVLSIFEDWKNRLWILTNNGIDIYDNSKEMFNKKYLNKLIFDTFDHIQVTSLIEDTNKDIYWIGTAQKGLFRYNSKTNTIKQYDYNFNDEFTLSARGIFDLEMGNNNDIWIGGIDGLYNLHKKSNKITKRKLDTDDSLALSDNWVLSLFKDNQNEIWIGSNSGGIFKYDSELNKIVPHSSIHNRNKILTIEDLHEDNEGNLWVGTYENGFYNYDRLNKKLKEIYSTNEGLSNNNVNSILDDEKGNLWIGTRNGLSNFNIKSKKFRNYFIEDGLCSNYFSGNSKLRLKNGILCFGTDAGLVYFHPDSIVIDSIPPQVVIQNISLFNRPDEKLEYEGFISDIDEITLPYNRNDLHFEYVGLHYGEPLRNKYKYILEGFDKDWIDAGNLRTATYTNLDPGEYLFRVKASNRDGIWNEAGASIKIIINPPLWATTWAYLFYLILFGSLLYYAWRMQLKRVRVKHEFEMSKFEAQKLHEVDELKSRFFANISHEFRTPLTLILGPVKQIIERTKETRTKEDLNLVHRNANRLLGLVNQLLDISKIESGNMKLQTAPINAIPYLKALVLSFTSYAERKRISLNFVSDGNEIIVYIDKDKFEKIINNILSNAFKFTPDDGSIKVIVNQHNENLKITVSDTGVGIPKEKLQKIFDRFYQVNGSHTREQEGTGIGLSLTKELVELHKGNIEVESEEGKGSTFIISIPLGTDHLKPDEIVELESDKTEHLITESIPTDTPVNKTNLLDIDLIANTDKPILLIVEDNYDVRNYIRNNLNNAYRVIEAVDGEDGWNKSTNNLPDLIVSDVMMPKMDGFELCKRIKTDERTSHIPVILLTAKAAKQDKLDGYEIGADDYIMKPFETDELSARIKNLIIQRKKLQEHFRKNGILGFGQSQITSVDKNFLQNILNKVNQHISDSSFSVELLSDDLGISRSVVHRKILSLTGETPGDLIRRIRLNKAAELIQKKFGNLSEIALEVGITNPSHFSENFKKQFGVSPSHYK
ncbi:MAG: ATP-binding protein [Ignavibacterium sp.]|jgi:signal transduction histidine kinase/ligand-binding sensor domain-containing protein/DNA-binding response OmpR family regulator|nr:ATP-binding protein [Ignavibacterium sp.]